MNESMQPVCDGFAKVRSAHEKQVVAPTEAEYEEPPHRVHIETLEDLQTKRDERMAYESKKARTVPIESRITHHAFDGSR